MYYVCMYVCLNVCIYVYMDASALRPRMIGHLTSKDGHSPRKAKTQRSTASTSVAFFLAAETSRTDGHLGKWFRTAFGEQPRPYPASVREGTECSTLVPKAPHCRKLTKFEATEHIAKLNAR